MHIITKTKVIIAEIMELKKMAIILDSWSILHFDMSNEITRGKKKFSFISMGLIFFLPGPKAPIINGTVKKGPKNKLRINHINGVPNVVLYPLHNIMKELIIKIIQKKS